MSSLGEIVLTVGLAALVAAVVSVTVSLTMRYIRRKRSWREYVQKLDEALGGEYEPDRDR